MTNWMIACNAAREDARRWERHAERLAAIAELLWAVVANTSGGDWTQQSRQWQTGAAQARAAYFAASRDGLVVEPDEVEPDVEEGERHESGG